MWAYCSLGFVSSHYPMYFPAVNHSLTPFVPVETWLLFFFICFCNNEVIPTFPADSGFAIQDSNFPAFGARHFLIYIATCQNNTLQSKFPAVSRAVVLPDVATEVTAATS